jgi:hypothetical protein
MFNLNRFIVYRYIYVRDELIINHNSIILGPYVYSAKKIPSLHYSIHNTNLPAPAFEIRKNNVSFCWTYKDLRLFECEINDDHITFEQFPGIYIIMKFYPFKEKAITSWNFVSSLML